MTDTSSEIPALEAALQAREAQLRAAKDAAYERAYRQPTRKNRDEYKAAEKALADFLRELHEPEGAEPVFAGIPEVLDYLEGDGWKCGKSKLYDDFGAGKIKAQPDGSFLLADAQEYARVHLKKADGTPGAAAGLHSLQEQKIREEVARIKADREQRELKLKEARGELIRKSDVEIELSKRTLYLRSDLKTVGRASAMKIIQLVGGDPQRAPQLIAFWTSNVDEIMDRYSRPVKGFEDE